MMTEKNLLWISLMATVFFSLLAIIWGIIAGSGIIIFDGLYSAISLGLSSLSLITLREINKGESKHFPFGRAQFEPLLVAFKSIMIMGMCIYASVNSLALLFRGGRNVETGSALIYAIIGFLGCIAITLLLGRHAKRIKSKIIDAERNQWLGDTLLSLSVLLAFLFAITVLEPFYPELVPFVDPFMVVFVATLFLIIPGRSLWKAMREIILLRPDDDIVHPFEVEAQAIADQLGVRHKVHVVVIGRQLEVEVNFLTKDSFFSVTEMDDIRIRFIEIASKLSERNWVNINFTQDETQL